MLRKLCLLDELTGTELMLPVTPPGYSWMRGVSYESVHIDQLGDIDFPGGRKLHQAKIECLLPAQEYPFLLPGAIPEPQHYLDQLDAWCSAKTVLRYIVSGTDVNEPVRIAEVGRAEDDGTNDVVCTIYLREYMSVSNLDTDTGRPAATAVTSAMTYVVVSGDTLSSIARRFYGDASLCWRLAAANGIANANLIYVGQVLTIPPIGQLPEATPAASRPKSAQVAAATKVTSAGQSAAGSNLNMSTPSKQLRPVFISLQ